MAKETNQPISYNKQTPREILMFTDLIVDVYCMFKKASWSSNSHAEIGFSLKNKVSKSSIFFGIWFEAWESFGIPICITLDYLGKAATDKYSEIEKLIESKSDKGLLFKSDYQGYALILVEHQYYNFQNDEERLFKLLNELKFKLEISTS